MKLLRVGWILSLAVAALVYPAAWMLDRGAVEAQMIAPVDAQGVVLNKGLFALDELDKKDPQYPRKVMEIYGNPIGEPMRFLFVPKEKFIHPEEMPSLTLLPVDKSKGENPLQAQTVWFFAKWTALGAASPGVLLLGLWFWLVRRRARAGTPPAPPTPAP